MAKLVLNNGEPDQMVSNKRSHFSAPSNDVCFVDRGGVCVQPFSMRFDGPPCAYNWWPVLDLADMEG